MVYRRPYCRAVAPELPVIWAEFGYSIWDPSASGPSSDRLDFARQFYDDFLRMAYESGGQRHVLLVFVRRISGQREVRLRHPGARRGVASSDRDSAPLGRTDDRISPPKTGPIAGSRSNWDAMWTVWPGSTGGWRNPSGRRLTRERRPDCGSNRPNRGPVGCVLTHLLVFGSLPLGASRRTLRLKKAIPLSWGLAEWVRQSARQGEARRLSYRPATIVNPSSPAVLRARGA